MLQHHNFVCYSVSSTLLAIIHLSYLAAPHPTKVQSERTCSSLVKDHHQGASNQTGQGFVKDHHPHFASCNYRPHCEKCRCDFIIPTTR